MSLPSILSNFIVERAAAALTFPSISPKGTPPPAHYSGKLVEPGGTSGDVTAGTNTVLGSFANTALNIITLIAGILAVIYLIWQGIQYITSAGSPDKAKAARAGIINAVIGIAIIAAAFFIIRLAISIGNSLSAI